MLGTYIRHAEAHLIKQNPITYLVVVFKEQYIFGLTYMVIPRRKILLLREKNLFFITAELFCLLVTSQRTGKLK